MTRLTHVTLTSGRTAHGETESQEVCVSLRYLIEPDDDLDKVIQEKATEARRARDAAWRGTTPACEPRRAEPGRTMPRRKAAPVTDATQSEVSSCQVNSYQAASPQPAPCQAKSIAGEGETITQAQLRQIREIAARDGVSEEDFKAHLYQRFRKSSAEDLTKMQASTLLFEMQRRQRFKSHALPKR